MQQVATQSWSGCQNQTAHHINDGPATNVGNRESLLKLIRIAGLLQHDTTFAELNADGNDTQLSSIEQSADSINYSVLCCLFQRYSTLSMLNFC